MYSVYILLCKGNRLYTGIAKDIEKRFAEHKKGTASKFTRAFAPMKIVYAKACKGKSNALQEEARIKCLPRAKKLELIKTTNK